MKGVNYCIFAKTIVTEEPFVGEMLLRVCKRRKQAARIGRQLKQTGYEQIEINTFAHYIHQREQWWLKHGGFGR